MKIFQGDRSPHIPAATGINEPEEKSALKTEVLIIGGGVTGTGLARDLALRGVQCLLVEKRDINAGASGANHGLLHSGARYIESDPAAACECRRENRLLKHLAPHCIEDVGGLFVAVRGDDENYIADFPLLCEQCDIPARPLTPSEARELEPALSEDVIAAYAVEDAAVDPFKLSLVNLSHAQRLGSLLLRHHAAQAIERRGSRIRSVTLRSDLTGETVRVEPEIVVNAAGAWAGKVAALAGADIHMLYSKGSMLVTQSRLATRVINRLRRATDADILVPGGTVSILGTTSVRVTSPDVIYPEVKEVDFIIDEGAAMMPVLEKTRYIRAYCGVRPLIGGDGNGDDRQVSRGYALIHHAKDGIENFVSITGGKLTTYRLMAEKTADLVCSRLGIDAACRTQTEPLPPSRDARWTEPGLAPHVWIKADNPADQLLCECEMIPQSAIEDVLAAIGDTPQGPRLTAIGLRSRVGKGPCQGTFCSQRITAFLYDRGIYRGNQGRLNLCEFLTERWRGQHPLLWNTALVQAELMEAMHCGLFGLELSQPSEDGPAG